MSPIHWLQNQPERRLGRTALPTFSEAFRGHLSSPAILSARLAVLLVSLLLDTMPLEFMRGRQPILKRLD